MEKLFDYLNKRNLRVAEGIETFDGCRVLEVKPKRVDLKYECEDIFDSPTKIMIVVDQFNNIIFEKILYFELDEELILLPGGNMIVNERNQVPGYKSEIPHFSHYRIKDGVVSLKKQKVFSTFKKLTEKTGLVYNSYFNQVQIYDVKQGKFVTPFFNSIGDYEVDLATGKETALAEKKHFVKRSDIGSCNLYFFSICVRLDKYGNYASPLYDTHNDIFVDTNIEGFDFDDYFDVVVDQVKREEKEIEGEIGLLRQRVYN